MKRFADYILKICITNNFKSLQNNIFEKKKLLFFEFKVIKLLLF